MPTYEYACRSCDQHVEVVQSFHDDPLTTCEACGGALRRVIHAAGILFKGSGFYSTDRRAARPQSKSKGKDSEKETASASGEPGKDDSKVSSADKSAEKDSSSSGASPTKGAAAKKAEKTA
ncbi:MAG: FmdB family zinc ribbon protein [Actinomycetota bacterium]